MRIPYLIDFIQDCRFSRQEEDYYTAETISVGPQEQIIYVRPLCAGQKLNISVFSPTLFTLQILRDDDKGPSTSARPARRSGLGSLSTVFQVKIPGWYLISIANEALQAADFSVIIEAGKRPRSVRTLVEKILL